MKRTLPVLLAVVVVGCGQVTPPPKSDGGKAVEEPKKEQTPSKPRTRAELKELLVGKGKDNVRNLLGRPHKTNEITDKEAWSYPGASYDPETGRADREAVVWIDREGVVERVTFTP